MAKKNKKDLNKENALLNENDALQKDLNSETNSESLNVQNVKQEEQIEEFDAKKTERKLSINKFFNEKTKAWQDWWANHSLFKKILFTLLILTLFIAAGTITIPGVNLVNKNQISQQSDFVAI